MAVMKTIPRSSGSGGRSRILRARSGPRRLSFLQDRLACISPQPREGVCHHGNTMQTDTLDAVETGSQMHPDGNAVDTAIRSRKAVRVFRPDAVSREVVPDILDVARHAPSNSNTQPWHVHVLTGRAKQGFSDRLHRAFWSDDHP